MSAFMVSHECISRVVFAIQMDAVQYHNYAPDLLGMQLVELNRLAIKARYGERPEVEPFQYQQPASSPLEVVQLFKSVRCFLYQCSEGDVPEAPLFKYVEQVRDRIAVACEYYNGRFANAAIQQAYDACEWG